MGCITLLSDLGLQDASVASIKGILMQICPDDTLIDISHNVSPFHLHQGAYLLSAAYANFPTGTCHLVLCDIFSDNRPQLVLGEKEGHYFLAPANGVLSLAFTNTLNNAWKCGALPDNVSLKDWVAEAARVIKQLKENSGELNLDPHELKNASANWRPKIEGNTVECHVIHIDTFGNVVLNITAEMFARLGRNRPFIIQLMRDEKIDHLSRRYFDVREGEKLCRFNSAGYLEISINRGNAADLLGLRLYRDKHLIYNTIKISFE